METQSAANFEPGKVYDYIFAGTGASASLLLMELERRELLKNKAVLLIDPTEPVKNYKTFCFWSGKEDPITKNLSNIISHSWTIIRINGSDTVNLGSLQYNHVSSIDLFKKAKEIEKKYSFNRITAPVESIENDDKGSCVWVSGNCIRGKIIFDSRTPQFHTPKEGQNHLFQSFTGWMIETEKNEFREDVFSMMDFNIVQNGHTQFVYILPFTPSKALVEVTRFGSEIIEKRTAEQLLESYIKSNFGAYTVLFEEQGCIPMSNASIDKTEFPGIVNIGARNYNIKPTTGYAFKEMYYEAVAIGGQLQHNQFSEPLIRQKTNRTGRFAFYDSLLLDILKHQPKEGKPIFEQLFGKVDIKTILHFLDQKTRLTEDVKIFLRLPWKPFLISLAKHFAKHPLTRPVLLLILTSLLILLGNATPYQSVVGNILLATGLIYVGIPHGAVDHLIDCGKWRKPIDFRFILKYLLLAFSLCACWYFAPSLTLLFFILFSAWHFGEVDGKEWELLPLTSFAWGASALAYILFTHVQETRIITNTIAQINFSYECPVWCLAPWLIWSILQKKLPMTFTIVWLLLATQLPLILSFGLYFIGQHSFTSWMHIQKKLQLAPVRIWIQSLPFHLGAWILLVLFYYYWPTSGIVGVNDLTRWGPFFIFIACISFPHTISMHRMYTAGNIWNK